MGSDDIVSNGVELSGEVIEVATPARKRMLKSEHNE
jgi:hypothetical protein